MKYRLQDLIDMEHFQNLQDRLNEIYSFPSSIIDNDGNILTATAWQDICTQFHRKNKDSERLCIQSDQYIRSHIYEANPAVSYRCPHGLVDNATPIIIDGIHYGNFFTGQFFLDKPDMAFFSAQAKKYGFDEDAYLEAVKKVPIWTQEQLNNYLFFIKGLIAVISESGLKKLKEVETRKQIEESENLHRSILQTAMDGFWLTDIRGQLLDVNDSYCSMSGYSRDELLTMRISDLEANESPEMVDTHMQKVVAQSSDRFESKHRRKDGTVFDIEVSVQSRTKEGGRRVCFLRDITEPKRAERALIDSERKWRNILVNTPQVGITLDPQARIVFANAHFLKLTGWKEREVIGRDWFDLFIPENIRQEVRRVYTNVMSQKDTHGFSTYENEIVIKSGELRNVAWSNVLTKDTQGNILDVTCLGIDLTERRLAEIALRESEAKYRLLVENQTDMLVKVDLEGRFLFVSPSYCRMFGKKEEELLDQEFMPFVHEEDRDSTAKAMEAFYSPPYTGNVELRALTKDGWRWLAWAGMAVLESDGSVKEIIGVGRDISDRKRAEEAMRESEAKYRSIMEAMDDETYICSSDFQIEYMNPAMKNKIGYDATGRFCYKEIHGLDEKCPWCIHEKVMKGETIKVERVNPKDGKTYHVSNSPIFHPDGSVSKLTVFRDITEIKKMESRIQQAQKMEAIGNLAGGIAHDFNNILFPIIGMAELLLEDLSPHSLEYENAKEILKAGKRGSDLVKQILAFSRQSEHKVIPVRIQSILKEILKLVRSTIPSNIEISEDTQTKCGLVMVDPTQLHQIVMNLITNAYHAVEEAGGKISVQLREVALSDDDLLQTSLEPGQYAMLTVSDTGCGIDPAIMDRIFEPYFTTKEQGKGTGLGLAVVYGIVKSYKGNIKVYSEVGKGTTFDVYLPLKEESCEASPVEKVESYRTGDERILLVDDEVPIVQLEKQILERLGYQVTPRTSSLDALETFRAAQDAFDLVVTDMTMPNMTGDRLAEKLIAIRPDIPVIICTGFSEKINEEKAVNMGIKGFLMKPIIKSEMAQMIRKVLDEAKI